MCASLLSVSGCFTDRKDKVNILDCLSLKGSTDLRHWEKRAITPVISCAAVRVGEACSIMGQPKDHSILGQLSFP